MRPLDFATYPKTLLDVLGLVLDLPGKELREIIRSWAQQGPLAFAISCHRRHPALQKGNRVEKVSLISGLGCVPDIKQAVMPCKLEPARS